MKKMVEVSDIKKLLNMIETLKYDLSTNCWSEFDKIIDFIEQHILKVDQDEKNEFKRLVYRKMKEASTEEENKKLYKLYKEIDVIFDKYQSSVSSVENRASRMLEILERLEEYGVI